MGILGFLTREKSAAPPTVEELEERLARLGIERRRLVEGQAERARRRRELLTIDETDVEIFENERDSDAASLALERLDETEPLLLSELSAARGRRRQAEWEKIRASYFPQAASFLHAARQARAEYEKVIGIRDQGLRAGFAAEVNVLAVPPWALQPDLLNDFDRQLERAEGMAPSPAPKPVAPTAKPAVAAPKLATKAKPAPVAPSKPFKAPQPDAAGNVQITVLRGGFEAPGGGRPRMGQTISLPADQAMQVVQSGSGDYAEAI